MNSQLDQSTQYDDAAILENSKTNAEFKKISVQEDKYTTEVFIILYIRLETVFPPEIKEN